MPDSPMPPASPASPMPASPQKQVIVESGPVTPATPDMVSDIEDEDFEGKFFLINLGNVEKDFEK